jgi:hypothetical protein
VVATILSDGRITVDVRVHGSPAATVNLIVDTGAEASALPFFSLPPAMRTAPKSQLVTFCIGGARIWTIRLNGAVAETDVEPHGRGGRVTQATSSPIRVHLQAIGTTPFIGFDGILGMDMLDDFGADPVKDTQGRSAYLALRV